MTKVAAGTQPFNTSESWVIDSTALGTTEDITVNFDAAASRMAWSAWSYDSDQLLPYAVSGESEAANPFDDTIDILAKGGVSTSMNWTGSSTILQFNGIDGDVLTKLIEGDNKHAIASRNFPGLVHDHAVSADYSTTVSNQIQNVVSFVRPGVLVADTFYSDQIAYPGFSAANGTITHDSANEALDFFSDLGISYSNLSYHLTTATGLTEGVEYTVRATVENLSAQRFLDLRVGTVEGSGNISSVPTAERIAAGATGEMVLKFVPNSFNTWITLVLRGMSDAGNQNFKVHRFSIEGPLVPEVAPAGDNTDVSATAPMVAGATVSTTVDMDIFAVAGMQAGADPVTVETDFDVSTTGGMQAGAVATVSTGGDVSTTAPMQAGASVSTTVDFTASVTAGAVAGGAATVSGDSDVAVTAGMAAGALPVTVTPDFFESVTAGISAGAVTSVKVDFDLSTVAAMKAGANATIAGDGVAEVIAPMQAGAVVSLTVDFEAVAAAPMQAGAVVNVEQQEPDEVSVVAPMGAGADVTITIDMEAATEAGAVFNAVVAVTVPGESIIPAYNGGTLYRLSYSATVYTLVGEE